MPVLQKKKKNPRRWKTHRRIFLKYQVHNLFVPLSRQKSPVAELYFIWLPIYYSGKIVSFPSDRWRHQKTYDVVRTINLFRDGTPQCPPHFSSRGPRRSLKCKSCPSQSDLRALFLLGQNSENTHTDSSYNGTKLGIYMQAIYFFCNKSYGTFPTLDKTAANDSVSQIGPRSAYDSAWPNENPGMLDLSRAFHERMRHFFLAFNTGWMARWIN